MPESAGIIFGGGFPRKGSDVGRRAAQRAVFAVQRELERFALEEGTARLVLCDRGTLDGVAYWPGDPDTLLGAMGTAREAELARYALVLHLRTPPPDHHDHQNPLRVESAKEALAIEERIVSAWDGHPRRIFLDPSEEFLDKVAQASAVLRDALRHWATNTFAELDSSVASSAAARTLPRE